MFRFNFLTVVIIALNFGVASAGDWAQILGPDRNGVAVGEQLLATWPADGPQEVWSSETGEGFAGVAVQGDTLILFHRQGESEIVEAREASTGKRLWETAFPCDYESGLSSDNGPRCVPLISADRVYVYGVQGWLRCLDVNSGKEIWSRDTWKDFSAPEGYFGAGSSPVLFGDRLIVNVGGRDSAAVVAFKAEDGRTLWQSFDDTASYSSPIIAEVAGRTHAIVVTRLHTVSLNPNDGTVTFQFPFGMRGPTVNGANPVVMNGHVFVTASYRVGSAWAEIAETTAPVLIDEEFLATQYATPVPHKDLLFAVDGRQDIGKATLKCLNPSTQKVLWQREGFHYGTLVRVNEELLFLTCDGELIRFAADRTGYRETQRCQILNGTDRQYRLPAISNGRLFVRDDTTLKCLQIGETAD
ncbi:MAG: PQQ-binding-like beta-propeller repeat protein [Planctomycetaceae bacterium]